MDVRYNEATKERWELKKVLSLLKQIKKESNVCDAKKVINKYIDKYEEELKELEEYMDYLIEEECKNDRER